MRIALLLVLVFVAGCATTRQYENNLRKWEGKPMEAVFKKWGSPDSTTTLVDGGKVYVFIKKNPDNIKVKQESDPKKVVPLDECRTTFLTDPQDIVIGWKFKGFSCRAD